MGKAGILVLLGFALVCRGFYGAAFWYADAGAEPFVLWGGWRILPGTSERIAGMALLAAGIVLALRAR